METLCDLSEFGLQSHQRDFTLLKMDVNSGEPRLAKFVLQEGAKSDQVPGSPHLGDVITLKYIVQPVSTFVFPENIKKLRKESQDITFTIGRGKFN